MITIVVPTLGRPSLDALAEALAPQCAALPDLEILLVDDRLGGGPALSVPAGLTPYAKVLTGTGTGPAAARNLGWHAGRHPWVVFLDDDVVPEPDWLRHLRDDLDVPDRVGGVQGRVRVPLPTHRRPTDWERATAGLIDGRWITADMAYRRDALVAAGGFDERFPRAFREDAELAHRVRLAGWRLVRGRRTVTHPVRPEGPWVSLRTQRGNADDALLRRLYGPGWRVALEVPSGRRHRHLAVTASAAVAAGAALALGATRRNTRPALGPVRRAAFGSASRNLRATGLAVTRRKHRAALGATALLGAAGWLAGTTEFAWARIAPGPRRPGEVGAMLATSLLIPPLAVGHWCAGWWRSRKATPLVPAQPWPVTGGPGPSGAVPGGFG